MSMFRAQVLIVGAGASGLTLACDLRRRGVGCRVIEKLSAPFPGSRGKGLQPRTLEVFDDLGIVEAVTRLGGPFPDFRGYDGNEVLWQRDLSTVMGLAKLVPDSSAPYSMWMLPQYATEAVLRERLAQLGGAVEWGSELLAFRNEADCVQATIRSVSGEEHSEFDYLVGCDGGRSFVRSQLGIPFIGETGTYRSIIADVHVRGVERGLWHMWLRSKNSHDRVTLCSLPGRDLFQFSAPLLPDDEREPSLASIDALFRERSQGFPVQFEHLQWSTLYRLNARLAARFREGRVLLAGDAAHVHSPFGGQGINTSIQDAHNLGWKLAAALRGAELVLESYENERRPVAADMLGLSSTLQRENYGRVAYESEEETNRDIYQLRINYRASTLSREMRAEPGRVRAGDRAPDAWCALASGMPCRLFDLYRGPHWTVLCTGESGYETAAELAGSHRGVRAVHVGSTVQPERGDSLIDSQQAFVRAYDISPAAQLTIAIRPDGYIGLITERDDLSSVRGYLDICGAPSAAFPST